MNRRSAVPETRFQIAQLAHQGVVLGVRHSRRIEQIIAVVMLLDLVSQLIDPSRRVEVGIVRHGARSHASAPSRQMVEGVRRRYFGARRVASNRGDPKEGRQGLRKHTDGMMPGQTMYPARPIVMFEA